MTSTLTLTDLSRHFWTEIRKKVKKSLIFIDEPGIENLHFNGGLKSVLQSGINGIRDFSSFESGSETDKKAVFILSGPVVGLRAEILAEIVKNSHFEYCVIISSASNSVHKFAKYPGKPDLDDQFVFNELEEQVLTWMGNLNFTCEILHFPVFISPVCTDFFVTPQFSDFFPLFDSDLAKSAEIFASINRNVQIPDQTGFETLPYELQVQIRMFANSFASVFQMLNYKEDIFTIGPFSRIVGEVLEKNRKKPKPNQQNVSLILIDRNLDLVGPSSTGFETVFDKIFGNLPQFPGLTNDVQIDMAPVFGQKSEMTFQDEFPSGCLKSENPEENTISDLIFQPESEIIKNLHQKFCKIFNSEPKSNPTVNDLESDLCKVVNFSESDLQSNVDLIQISRSIVQSRQDCKSNQHVQDLQSKFVKLFAKIKDVRSFAGN